MALGDDRFFQGDCGTRRRFIDGIYGAFGFGDRSGTADGGVYSDVSFRFVDVVNGAAKAVFSDASTKIDTSHWYRFLADFDFETGLYDVKIYDMGAEHPSTTALPVGEPFYTRTGLKFRPTASGGITSICLNTYGNPVHLPSDPEDPGLALYDNFKVWQDPRGASIIVR